MELDEYICGNCKSWVKCKDTTNPAAPLPNTKRKPDDWACMQIVPIKVNGQEVK